jgi:prepilin-type N-terminal cleavage/methylation domain-containing protein
MRSKKGYSLVELVLVMMLLVLVASLVFSLTAAGSRAWMRLTESGNRRTELRTAMSYIDVQLKKSDSLNSVSIGADPTGSGAAIKLIREIKNPTIPDFNHPRPGYIFKTVSYTSCIHCPVCLCRMR